MAIFYLMSVVICAVIDVSHFAQKNIQNIPIGVFLIFFPIINIIYSIYVIIKYFNKDSFKEFL